MGINLSSHQGINKTVTEKYLDDMQILSNWVMIRSAMISQNGMATEGAEWHKPALILYSLHVLMKVTTLALAIITNIS